MIDHANMLGILDKFPEQCKEALKIAKKARLSFKRVNNAVICSFGAEGAIAKGMERKIPIIASSSLPSFVDKSTLFVAVTYTGEDSEIVDAYRSARRRKAQAVLITSNEKLAGKDRNVIIVPAGMKPRLSVSYNLISIAVALQKAKAVPGQNMAGALSMLVPKTCSREGFMVSKHLKNKIPMIYATPAFEGVAKRLKIMINRNAKIPAFCNVVPDAYYTEIEGLKRAMKKYHILFIHDGEDKKDVLRPIEVFKKLMKRKIGADDLKAKGSSIFAQLLYLVYVCDYIAYYLALMNKEDPTPTPIIDEFKEKMSER
jgi:glucose/mannose-6-phosphate isomerase